MRRLNNFGYGLGDGGLILNLVYNPTGAFLPPAQAAIEADFKRELAARYGVSFNRLYTITNMPIKIFLDYLRRTGNEDRYMRKLVEAFNPHAVEGLICRSLLSSMDVPVRSAYVMAVVTPPERPAAASVTAVPRSLASAVSPLLSGWLLAATPFGWPLVIGGALKAAYDLALLRQFAKVRPSDHE